MKLPAFSFSKSTKDFKEFFRYGGTADSDWKIILVSFVILNIISIILNVSILLSIAQGDFSSKGVAANEDLETFSRKVLSDRIIHFQNKAKNLEQLKKNPQAFADPSL